MCVVDDAQWLDRASLETLAFVARRLFAEPLALILATREAARRAHGLARAGRQRPRRRDAQALLDSVVSGPLDEEVRDRIVDETRGNPLALLELPRGLTPTELAGGFILPDAPLSGRIEASFRQRLESLPADTRLLVLAAAADPLGDAALLWRACARLGIAPGAAAPAEEAGLLTTGGRVTFFHPLVRSAVYQGAAAVRPPSRPPRARRGDRSRSSTPTAAPGIARRPRPDRTRTSPPSSSAPPAAPRRGAGWRRRPPSCERATALTADPSRRTERALAAAQAKHEAGDADAALDFLALAEQGPLDELQRARAERLRARLAFAQRRGSDAPPLLLRAAERLEPLDARARARDVPRSARRGALHRPARVARPRVAGAARRAAARAAARRRAAPDGPGARAHRRAGGRGARPQTRR